MLKLKKGFTLIELMIVVFIIAILAAIVIPNFAIYMEKNEKSLKSDKQLEETIDLDETEKNEPKEGGSKL